MKNDLGRYRKLFIRLWRHPGFAQLTDGEKVLALYVLTGPQTNRLGLYNLSIATAAEELETVTQTLSKRLVTVCQTFGWVFDKRSRVIFIPSWFKWNPPENENVMKGSLKDLNEIPPCGLLDAFARNLETVPETLRQTFIEGLRQRLPNGMPNQEQEPYQDLNPDQKQKPAEKKQHLKERSSNGASSSIVAIAHKTLSFAGVHQPIDELVDAFFDYHRHNPTGAEYSRSQALEALNIALAERRQSA